MDQSYDSFNPFLEFKAYKNSLVVFFALYYSAKSTSAFQFCWLILL